MTRGVLHRPSEPARIIGQDTGLVLHMSGYRVTQEFDPLESNLFRADKDLFAFFLSILTAVANCKGFDSKNE